MDCCFQGTICFEMMKGVPAAFVTLVIGGIAGLITYRQYKVAQAKLKLDLFERRYAIFHKTWVILSETVQGGTTEKNYGLFTPFNNFLPEAAFLFGPEITEYLTVALRNWTWLRALEAEKNGVQGPDRVANIAKASELRTWFVEQASTGAKAMFSSYLNFENWK
jgi:hypothetical protein